MSPLPQFFIAQMDGAALAEHSFVTLSEIEIRLAI
jgi:hypothetical protein